MESKSTATEQIGVGQLLLSNSTRNRAFLVQINDKATFFSETLKEAREAIVSLATQCESDLRKDGQQWVRVSREVLENGDEIRVLASELGRVYDSTPIVEKSYRIITLPWLSPKSPLFTQRAIIVNEKQEAFVEDDADETEDEVKDSEDEEDVTNQV